MSDELTLLIIRGLPGSGKTTLSEFIGLPYCEADQFWEEYDYDFDPELLSATHTYCFSKVESYLASGQSVIVSNTSSADSEFEDYYDLADEYDARVISLIVENRHNGRSIHEVPAQTIQRMRARFSVRL